MGFASVAILAQGLSPLFLSAGFKGHFKSRMQSITCDACHRNAPRWVVKRCLAGKVLRRDSEYWVCSCRHWQWIPCKVAVPSSKESNSKRAARNPIGDDGKHPRGPLLSDWVGKVLGKPSVEPPRNTDDPVSIPIMMLLKRGRLVNKMRQMLMSTIKCPCSSPRSRTSKAHPSRHLCCLAWLHSWKRSSVQRSWRDVSPGRCGGKQDVINDKLTTAGRNWPSSRNVSWGPRKDG